jgi:hypothetical protein
MCIRVYPVFTIPIYESLVISAVEMEATFHPLSGYGARSCVGRFDQWVSIDDSFVKRHLR